MSISEDRLAEIEDGVGGVDMATALELIAEIRSLRSDLSRLDERVREQDRKHGGLGKSVGDVRLGLACLEDEVAEALQAWHIEKRLAAGRGSWELVAGEVLDVAAVAYRLLRDMA